MSTKLARDQVDGLVLSAEEFGAVGDGVTDDTSKFNLLNAFIASVAYPVEVRLEGTYLVDPLLTTTPLGSSYAALINLTTDGSMVTGTGTVKINSATNYTTPFSAGDEKYWSVVQINANNCQCKDFGFDGNGTHTASGYNPAVVNIRWQHVASFGVIGTHRKGNKVIGCNGTDFGGQAVSFQFQDSARILANNFDKHSGMGVSVGNDPQVAFNSSSGCYDAPYPLNGSIVGGKVVYNYLDGNTNGSGIDIMGCSNTEVAHNYIKNAKGAGVLVSYSVQQTNASNNVHVHHNIFETNAQFTGAPVRGEVVIGSDTVRADNATDVVVEHNTFIIDGSISANADRCVIIDAGTHDVTVKANKVKGTANSNNRFASILYDAENLKFISNKSQLATQQLINVGAGTTNTLTSTLNEGIAVDPSGTLFPNVGVLQEDGSTLYSVQKTIGTSAENILVLDFESGAFTYAVIEVQAVQSGEFRGVTLNRLTSRGYNAVSPTVVSNTVVEAQGPNPPLVTTAVASGQLTVKLNSVGASSVTELSIRVIGDSLGKVF